MLKIYVLRRFVMATVGGNIEQKPLYFLDPWKADLERENWCKKSDVHSAKVEEAVTEDDTNI